MHKEFDESMKYVITLLLVYVPAWSVAILMITVVFYPFLPHALLCGSNQVVSYHPTPFAYRTKVKSTTVIIEKAILLSSIYKKSRVVMYDLLRSIS